MTIYIARVNQEGQATSIWTTGAIPDIPEGPDQYDNTMTIVHVEGAIADLSHFINTHYYKEEAWLARETSPGSYYNWVNEAWLCDSVKLMEEIRQERDSLLFQCDWTQLSDTPLTDEKKGEWGTYRQYLRDVPTDNSSATDLGHVAWPTPPT